MNTQSPRCYVTFFIFLSIWVVFTRGTPQSLNWEWYYKIVKQGGTNIYNMTMAMYKNMDMKYRHADLLTELHRGSLEYMLGSIASALKSKFKLMLRIYRRHSDFNKLAWGHPSVEGYTTAYAQIDSIYHEIRVLRDLFWDTVKYQEKNEKKRKAKDLEELRKKVFEEFGINITSVDIDPDKFRLYRAYAEQLAKRDKKLLRGLKPPRVKGFGYLVKKFQKQEQDRLKKAQEKEDAVTPNDNDVRRRRFNPRKLSKIPR